MKEETGATYKPATNMIKLLAVAESKDGKTSNLVGGCLGVLPNQTQGGVISNPNNLHVICTDTAALDKLRDFLVTLCGASEAALQYKVYNMEEDYLRAFQNEYGFASGFYNTLLATINKIAERCKSKPNETSAVIFSSITTISRALLRGIQGGIVESEKDSRVLKKSTMDMNKWSMLQMQLNELQALGQSIPAHVIWEGHLGKKTTEEKDDKGKAIEIDSIQVPGSVGESWAANVSHPMVLVRQKGIVHIGTKVDKTYFDTQPNLKMFGIGRGAATHLNKQEPDITIMLEKLGYKVGKWKDEGKEEE